MNYVLLTRPKIDSLKVQRSIRREGFKVFIESMFRVSYTPIKEDISKFDVIISSSKHSLISLKKIIKKCEALIITVGDHTRKIARKIGAKNVVSVSGTIGDVISYCENNYMNDIKILYIRGDKVTCDLKSIMIEKGFYQFKEIIVYKTIERGTLSRRCCEILRNHHKLIILIYSSLTAEIFVDLITKYNLINNLRESLICVISEKVAEVVRRAFSNVYVAEFPTNKALLKLIGI